MKFEKEINYDYVIVVSEPDRSILTKFLSEKDYKNEEKFQTNYIYI